jgi:hypothetical protein
MLIIKMMMMTDMPHRIFVVLEVKSYFFEEIKILKFFCLESPSRAEWDDDDFDKRRSQWEHPTPNDSYNRQGYRRQRDTDYYNRYEYNTR